ncbi:MAG: hypothetical protein U0183_11430 [Polyangiaceae bacterium]
MTTLSAPLTKDQKLLLAEALRRCELSRDAIEDAVVELGRWLLVHVFEDDSTAALEGRRDNPVWRELLERAGGPSLKLPKPVLHTSVRIAAYDKRIQDEAWRNLEAGRKELLLPLGTEDALREGAQHVTAMKLSHRDTKAYVKAHLAPKERPREKKTSRFVTRRVSSMTKRLDAPFRKAAVQAFAKGSPEDRAAIKEELTALRDLAAQLLADLKGK